MLPGLFVSAFLMLLGLGVSLVFRRARPSRLHTEAVSCVPHFIEQYPFHLYPVVAKSLELAYLREQLRRLEPKTRRIVEIAIGDGTFSARLFPAGSSVTGLELNPYSLVKALRFPHVARAIVADGLNPPLRAGAFDLLVSFNLLNHVTKKEATIDAWANAARFLLFTENSPSWATGWPVPHMARRLGLGRYAERRAREIAASHMQQLDTVDALTRRLDALEGIERVARESFMSERTFFRSSIFSFLMRCYGPPTPARLKKLFLGPLRWCALPLTQKLAELLIRRDALEDRSDDTFVAFLYQSRRARGGDEGPDLVCARCRSPLEGAECPRCGTRYERSDGMLFLLPDEMRFIADEYNSEHAAKIAAEHL